MLTQYCFSLGVPDGARPRPEWGYRLYAALLERLPPEFGASVHSGETTPFFCAYAAAKKFDRFLTANGAGGIIRRTRNHCE